MLFRSQQRIFGSEEGIGCHLRKLGIVRGSLARALGCVHLPIAIGEDENVRGELLGGLGGGEGGLDVFEEGVDGCHRE